MNIRKLIYLNCGQRYEFMIDHRCYVHNLCSCVINPFIPGIFPRKTHFSDFFDVLKMRKMRSCFSQKSFLTTFLEVHACMRTNQNLEFLDDKPSNPFRLFGFYSAISVFALSCYFLVPFAAVFRFLTGFLRVE